jgi:hypothetical protein
VTLRFSFVTILTLSLCAGCSAAEGSAAATLDGGADANALVDAGGGDDVAMTLDTGVVPADADETDAAPPFPADEACEHAFFAKYFDAANGDAYAGMRDETFTYIDEQVKGLRACGAGITLGGMLSLMIYEGGGAKVAFFNDRCAENSYDSSATCWTNPKARYSYQYGLAPVHTSNFHPCADVTYTSMMRKRLATAIANAGFAPSATAIAGVAADLHTFCPSSTPTVVDYYILTAHSAFGVPKNGTGNDLANAGKFPFFTPRVVIDLFFASISGSCAALTDDPAAISVFGGADTSYRTAAKQQQILALWKDFRAANPSVCGP